MSPGSNQVLAAQGETPWPRCCTPAYLVAWPRGACRWRCVRYGEIWSSALVVEQSISHEDYDGSGFR